MSGEKMGREPFKNLAPKSERKYSPATIKQDMEAFLAIAEKHFEKKCEDKKKWAYEEIESRPADVQSSLKNTLKKKIESMEKERREIIENYEDTIKELSSPDTGELLAKVRTKTEGEVLLSKLRVIVHNCFDWLDPDEDFVEPDNNNTPRAKMSLRDYEEKFLDSPEGEKFIEDHNYKK